MFSRPALLVSASLISCCAAVYGASAQQYIPSLAPDAVAQVGGFYAGLGGQLRFVELPAFNSHVASGSSTTPLLKVDPTVTTGGLTVLMGYQLPWSLGNRPRVEFGFGYVSGSSTDDFNYAFGAADVFRSVDGQISGVQGGAGTSSNTLRSRVSSYDFVLRLKTDYALGGALTLSPAIGFVAGTGRKRYSEAGTEAFAGGGFTTNSIETRLNSNYFGGEFGADLAWRFAPAWQLHGHAALAIFHQNTRLRANDCASAGTAAPLPACDGTFFRTSTSSSKSTAGVRFAAALGTTYTLAWARVTAQGFVSINSASAGARVPAGGAPGVASAPASIFHDDRLSYGLAVGVTIPLF